MEYGKTLLKQYGWKEGDGLGLHGNGIVKPIKASLKFDKSGLGDDKSAEYKNNWWETLFDQASKNIEIKKTETGLSINERNPIKTNTNYFSNNKLNKNSKLYNTFIKASKLSVNQTVEENGNIGSVSKLTDDELFTVCGGRTAHKGARHGLNLNGKLLRVKKQEELFLENCETLENSLLPKTDNDDLNGLLDKNEYTYLSKGKYKKKKKLENLLSMSLNSISLNSPKPKNLLTINADSVTIKKKKNKKNKIISKSNNIKKEIDGRLEASTDCKANNSKLEQDLINSFSDCDVDTISHSPNIENFKEIYGTRKNKKIKPKKKNKKFKKKLLKQKNLICRSLEKTHIAL